MKFLSCAVPCAVLAMLFVFCLSSCGADASPTPVPGPAASPGPRSFGHEAVDAFASLTSERLDAVRAMDIYFEHASVGWNMMQGMQTLIDSGTTINRQSYPGGGADDTTDMNQTKADAIKAWFTANDGLYDNYRGNPALNSKISWFVNAIDTFGIAGSADVAFMKFCWIDDAGETSASVATTRANEYIDAMSALETEYPAVDFIYVTMPLDTSVNAFRNSFNATLRTWCATNNRWLYDIADMECHDTDGSMTDESILDSYTGDGGHPNATLQPRIAQALWVLFDAIAQKRAAN